MFAAFKPVTVILLMVALLLTGCDVFGLKEQYEKAEAFCQLRGSVRSENPNSGNLVVVLLRHKDGLLEQKANWNLVDHFVLDQPGHWFFYVRPGTYYLTAFDDLNHDLIYERDEPTIPPNLNKLIQCGPGQIKANLDLVIPRDGRIPVDAPIDISKLQARSTVEQMNVALGQVTTIGEVTTLQDSRFSRENAHKGLWQPFDFLWENKPGIYFLEPYQPEKIPVLFVHGINGTPLDFSYLIEQLDRSRFQPWVLYYPSGGRLQSLGAYLDQMVTRLQAEYRFRQLLVVAHSMGGLVARSFILRHTETERDNRIPLFVSIASPWDGHKAARLGVNYAPNPIRVWYDLAPGSEFLTRLFYTGKDTGSTRRFLPATTTYHLIFAFLPTESGDGTISLTSQLRWEAQQEAAHLYGISQSHAGVLTAPRTAELLNRLLSSVEATTSEK